MVNITVVRFTARAITKVSYVNNQRVLQKVMREHTQCYVNKTDNEIHDQLNGWDPNYQLALVLRLLEPTNIEFNRFAAYEYNVTVIFFTVMNMPFTEVFYNQSFQEISNELQKRNYQSYSITNVIQSNNYKIDALNSITKFKDTN